MPGSIERLQNLGHELRRPEADYLRDGIYELRVGLRGMNYRMLYFFHGRTAAVLGHGLVKEREVPPREIEGREKGLGVFCRSKFTEKAASVCGF